MAAGTVFPRSFVMVEDGFSNDGEERSQNPGQLDVGKPPKNLTVVRHSISTATLLTPTDPYMNYYEHCIGYV
nr:probable protein phosphatase 2C 27 [Tanacetum cinerariifolium]